MSKCFIFISVFDYRLFSNPLMVFFFSFHYSSPEKNKKLLEIFQYELSLPLSGIQEVYIEFRDFIESSDLDVDLGEINEIYHNSKDNLRKILIFEQKLVSLEENHHHERANTFSEYIENCKSFLNEQMVQVLYERMVAACCLNGKLKLRFKKMFA